LLLMCNTHQGADSLLGLGYAFPSCCCLSALPPIWWSSVLAQVPGRRWPQWVSVDLSGPQWIPVGLSESQWASVDPSGTQWISVGLSGSQWVSVDLSGSQWVSVDLRGPQPTRLVMGGDDDAEGNNGVNEVIHANGSNAAERNGGTLGLCRSTIQAWRWFQSE